MPNPYDPSPRCGILVAPRVRRINEVHSVFKAYAVAAGALKAIETAGPDDLRRAVWIDMWAPTPAEIATVERAAGVTIKLPETADRFYVSDQVEPSDGQMVLRALVLGGLDRTQPKLIPVTFIRASATLVTVSKGSPDGLTWLLAECPASVPDSTRNVFPMLLDMVIDHATNVLDGISRDLDAANRLLFQHHAAPKRRFMLMSAVRRRTRQLETIMTDLGYMREVLVKLRRSVQSFRRLVGLLRERHKEDDLAGPLRQFEHELGSIAEAEVDLASTASFMLDGAVGYITILQSKTINIMTVLGILLTPPVLVASIYGMNFKFMPELQWEWGYPFALGLMVVSTAVVYFIVRARGWL